MANLLRQQARMELGPEFTSARKQCLGFIRFILNKGWYEKARVLRGEGGSVAMLDRMLGLVAYYGNVADALDWYGNYISSEYGKKLSRNNDISLSVFDDKNDIPSLEKLQVAGPVSLDTGQLVSEESLQLVEDESLLFNDDVERLLFTTMASVGGNSVKAACEVLGWDLADGRRIYKRVKKRHVYDRS